jgi:short-subunit dehydrogenase
MGVKMSLSFRERYGPAALVTGASSGIGAEFARVLAAQGLDLVLVARRREILLDMAGSLSGFHGVQVHALGQDLTEPGAAKSILQATDLLGVDVGLLINNAGLGVYGDFGAGDLDKELALVDLNCRAAVELSWRFLPGMKERGKGGIIFLSSILAHLPAAYLATYSATKAFNELMGQTLHSELQPFGIDVLSLTPGSTATPFHESSGLGKLHVPQRKPEQVVETALKSLGCRPRAVDGILNNVLVWIQKFLPRSWVIAMNRRFIPPPDR